MPIPPTLGQQGYSPCCTLLDIDRYNDDNK